MMATIDPYLRDKYTGDHPDSDRFKDERGEYHASNVSNCPRYWWWQFKRDGEDDWSPYFELGRQFELIYGAALAWEYGDFDDSDLKLKKPWEIANECDRVRQDVNIKILIDDEITITGESDWVVFREGKRYDIDRVVLDRTGDEPERTVVLDDGSIEEYDDDILKVVETKTTKKIEWREKYGHKKKHQYQLGVYMWAMDSMGELVYMTRNELDEMVFEFTRNPQIESDIEIRVRRHHQNLLDETPPDTDPLTDRACKWCEYKDECQSIGGSHWE